jgi:hypothetical protein
MSVTMEAPYLRLHTACQFCITPTTLFRLSRTGEDGAAKTHHVMKKKKHGEDVADGKLVL